MIRVITALCSVVTPVYALELQPQQSEQLKKERLAEKVKDNTVLRLTMEDGKQIVVDLGPNAKNNVIESGDRVTLIGQRKERSGRTVLDATRLSINDQIMWNTNGQGEPTRADRG